MHDELKAPEEVILARLMRLNALVYGLVAGLVAGFGLFAATIWLVIKGGPHIGTHLGLLAHYFPGYQVTVLGSLIGFAYAFACAFVVGYGVAWIYNRIVGLKVGG